MSSTDRDSTPALPAGDVIARDVEHALSEDLGSGDATADLLPADAHAHAQLLCRDEAVIAGRAWFDACFHRLDPDIAIAWTVRDGERVAPDTVLCRLQGNARALVSAERTALNFLQTLSGTATRTARYVAAVAGTGTRILDTRKTLPGLRLAQKYAVRCGGGHNHRIGLYDAILIKENHIAAAGGLREAVLAARARHPQLLLEVEVENLDELEQALAAGVDRVMLDEFGPDMLDRAVARAKGKVELEVSGGVDLDSIGAIAQRGVDYISVGALTKHVHAVDLSFRVHMRDGSPLPHL
ncbi:carboxylating nicotinate-nucleotide diphosphorylase [Oleiagrimonas soli]|uniref:Probable nicotinate-nucleotide pyrophosphorylase [carboxylating] n=1 Tax=Oleiagrimonas soli TaxID=1543381 RepID=A0A099CYB0_9GAMM|nr:carboxylating nicotinate-nucleotide diphosphorylase [Oleiagrimonas soli]KGI78656.1 nicotinate-nucleotide pyrophosphorylase [Oleiagrimonas soli]MBB6184036.1 nicotinate-nucleotide pyrophosphorylase (carboxylating) [Oleiagrimonas soli]